MKVCIITNLFGKYSRGGAERVAEQTAKGLANAGHEVFVITTNPFYREQLFNVARKKHEGRMIYSFYPLNVFWYGHDYKHNFLWRAVWHVLDIFNLHSALVIKKILKSENPDIVLTHNLMGIGFLTPWAIKKSGIKNIHTLHDVQLVNPSGLIIWGEEDNWLNNSFLYSWYTKLCRKLFGSPYAVISPSKWLLKFYNACGFFPGSKKQVLPNPVNLESRDLEKHEKDSFNILYVGQIEDHKGILWAIDLFKEIENPDLRFTIVGGGSVMSEAQFLSVDDNRINFKGPIPHEEIGEIYAEADLVVVPSFCYENSPSVIYEAYAHGVPVVASDIGGVGELIEEGKNGFTFETGNEEQFTSLLEYCSKHAEKMREMGEYARENVREYNIENYIEKLEDLF